MRRAWVVLVALLMMAGMCEAQYQAASPWLMKVRQELPLLGHRNWILIVDSAYPLQTSSGVEVLETGQPQIAVVRSVLKEIERAPHVRPVVFLDRELEYVPADDFPKIGDYRNELMQVLKPYPISPLLHEEALRRISEDAKTYKVLILKTTMTMPYTSVFLRLDCKYLNDEGEQKIRRAMKQAELH